MAAAPMEGPGEPGGQPKGTQHIAGPHKLVQVIPARAGRAVIPVPGLKKSFLPLRRCRIRGFLWLQRGPGVPAEGAAAAGPMAQAVPQPPVIMQPMGKLAALAARGNLGGWGRAVI